MGHIRCLGGGAPGYLAAHGGLAGRPASLRCRGRVTLEPRQATILSTIPPASLALSDIARKSRAAPGALEILTRPDPVDLQTALPTAG